MRKVDSWHIPDLTTMAAYEARARLQREGHDDPAVATILARAGAEISAAEERQTGQHKDRDRKGNSGWWEKKAANPPRPRTASPR